MRIIVESAADLGDDLKALFRVAFPARAPSDPFFGLSWAPKDYRVIVRDEQGQLCSNVAFLLRRCLLNDEPVTVGGIGSVSTMPDRRGQGIASVALERACHELKLRGADFGLLFCMPTMPGFYSRSGWRLFDGEVLVEQPGKGSVPFTFGKCMSLDMKQSPKGRLDLCGLPW
ncbi:MAG: GNAT family N-acetyltransferase [Alphaproteobacteria bacterium]